MKLSPLIRWFLRDPPKPVAPPKLEAKRPAPVPAEMIKRTNAWVKQTWRARGKTCERKVPVFVTARRARKCRGRPQIVWSAEHQDLFGRAA